ncbi:MAG: response regulator [Gammaproteobacteria bacterium]
MSELKQVEILLVEDSQEDAEITIRGLQQANLANNLVWLKDGVEALDFLFQRGRFNEQVDYQPRLILLDLKMPKLDGIEVLAEIKKDPRTRSIPVVMLTSSAEENDIVRSYDLGVNSYLVKPVDFRKFSEEIAKAGVYWLVMNKLPG